jgi:hypothetical protein
MAPGAPPPCAPAPQTAPYAAAPLTCTPPHRLQAGRCLYFLASPAPGDTPSPPHTRTHTRAHTHAHTHTHAPTRAHTRTRAAGFHTFQPPMPLYPGRGARTPASAGARRKPLPLRPAAAAAAAAARGAAGGGHPQCARAPGTPARLAGVDPGAHCFRCSARTCAPGRAATRSRAGRRARQRLAARALQPTHSAGALHWRVHPWRPCQAPWPLPSVLRPPLAHGGPPLLTEAPPCSRRPALAHKATHVAPAS